MVEISRRAFVRGAVGAAVTVGAGTALYSRRIEPHDLELTTVPVAVGLNTPLRIALLGDIHFDPLYEESYVARIASKITAQRPDLILYAGDFFTETPDHVDVLGRLLSQAQARLGAFAVLGNHDHAVGADEVVAGLQKRDIRVLMNESIALPGEDDIFLTGLDSFWNGQPDTGVLARTRVGSKHLLLVHEPDSFAVVRDSRITLQMSGHTHGGQIRMPLIGALHLPVWGKLYSAGLYSDGARKLYVNRGIGTLKPHVRFDCRPEITLFELS